MQHYNPVFIGLLLLTSTFGYAVGRNVQLTLHQNQTSLVIASQKEVLEPTVRIDGIRNGNIEGSILGNVRLLFGEQYVVPNAQQHFSVDAKPLLTNIITIEIPPGMRFVASSKGSKYYAVDTAGGSNIAIKNRVYFTTAQAAEQAGYKK